MPFYTVSENGDLAAWYRDMCAHARTAACKSLSDSVSAVQALEELRKQPSGWWGVVLSPLVTQIREYHTIHNLSTFPVSHAFCHLAISCQLCMHVCHLHVQALLQYSQEHLHRMVAKCIRWCCCC